MLKKTLLISGSRFALALCAGFAFTGVDAASAQMASSNAGCLINVTSSVLGSVATTAAGVSEASTGFNATSVACAGVAYALTSPLQPTISSPQPEVAGHGAMVGGPVMNTPLLPAVVASGPQTYGVMQGTPLAPGIGAGAIYDSTTGTVTGIPQRVGGGSLPSLGQSMLVADAGPMTADGGLFAGFRGESPGMPNERMSPARHGQEGRDHDDFGTERGTADRHMEHQRSERDSVVGVRTRYDRPPYRILRPVPTPVDLPIQYTPGANGNPTATVNLVTGSPSTGTTTVTTTGPVTSGPPTASTAAAQAYAASQAIANLGAMTVKYDATTQDAQPSVTLASPNGAGPVAIHNVAPGVAASDAATIGQLNQMGAAINSRLAQDEREIYNAKSLARGAGAVAMATASLRYDDRVGRGSVGFGLGNFSGATALATGLNYNVTEALRVNANAAYVPNTRNVGFGLGATYTFW
ncbi:MAG TPA: YadA-like family protein [Beijerinckiaceae bacterium]|nr:YadA-like family protein [Beijerinckiaceae bacterium]